MFVKGWDHVPKYMYIVFVASISESKVHKSIALIFHNSLSVYYLWVKSIDEKEKKECCFIITIYLLANR